jgi:hypothetical protein
MGRNGRAAGLIHAGGFAVNVCRAEVRYEPWCELVTTGEPRRMRRQGVEGVKGKMSVIEPAKESHRRLSKAELCEQTEAAVLAWRANQTSKNKQLLQSRENHENRLCLPTRRIS